MVTFCSGSPVGAGVEVEAPEPHGLRVQVADRISTLERASRIGVALGKPRVGITLHGKQADVRILHQTGYLVAHHGVGLAPVRVVIVEVDHELAALSRARKVIVCEIRLVDVKYEDTFVWPQVQVNRIMARRTKLLSTAPTRRSITPSPGI